MCQAGHSRPGMPRLWGQAALLPPAGCVCPLGAHPTPCPPPMALPARRLREEGLQAELWGTTAQLYIAGGAGGQSLEQAVAAIQAAKAEVAGREGRRNRITELLTNEGLQAYLPEQFGWGAGAGWGGYYGGGLRGLPGVRCQSSSAVSPPLLGPMGRRQRQASILLPSPLFSNRLQPRQRPDRVRQVGRRQRGGG